MEEENNKTTAFCPNCGQEYIIDEDIFCRKCGTKLVQVQPKCQNCSETLTKKIAIFGTCVILVILTIFGFVKYNQYKNDILPVTIERKHNNTEYNISYIPSKKQTLINIVFKDVIIEQWQVDLYNKLKDKNNLLNFKFMIVDKNGNVQPPNLIFYKTNVELKKPFSMEFVINNQKAKDYAIFKENIVVYFDNKQAMYTIPQIFSDEKTERDKGKQILQKIIENEEREKEAELKQKEWQNKILSNCVYKTSKGVCFTTTIFEFKPIIELDNSRNYWLGAKDACESQGYKLPSDSDLRSLFGDIMGVVIRSGVGIETEVDPAETPINYNVLKKISPNNPKDLYFELWENEVFDNEHAYYRTMTSNILNYKITKQHFKEKTSYDYKTICVYNPDGKPHKPLSIIKKEEKEKYELEKQQKKQQKMDSEAENDLF